MDTIYLTALVASLAPAAISPPAVEHSAIRSQIAEVVRFVTPVENPARPADSEWFCEVALLISADGFVVSNSGISRETKDVVALRMDGSEVDGRMVALDRFSNLALYKISGSVAQLPALGDAEELASGDVVYALGATADGLPKVVSTRVRNPSKLVHSSKFPIGPYIELEKHPADIPITGPIFNRHGKVVGFVVLENTPDRADPIVLASHVSDVKRIADELRTAGKVRRSRIGVEIKRVTEAIATAKRLAEPGGAFIAAVAKQSPAERAGLLPGDLILTFAGAVIRKPEDYLVAIGRVKAGTTILVEVLGDGGKRVVKLTTGEVVSGPAVGQAVRADPKSAPLQQRSQESAPRF